MFQVFQGVKVQHGLPIYSIEVRETDEAVLNCYPGDFMYDERFEDYEGVGRHHLELGDQAADGHAYLIRGLIVPGGIRVHPRLPSS